MTPASRCPPAALAASLDGRPLRRPRPGADGPIPGRPFSPSATTRTLTLVADRPLPAGRGLGGGPPSRDRRPGCSCR